MKKTRTVIALFILMSVFAPTALSAASPLIETGTGIVCNTSAQLINYLKLADTMSKEDAIKRSNDVAFAATHAKNACGIITVGYVRHGEVDSVPEVGGVDKIVRIEVVAVYDDEALAWRILEPAEWQYTAFFEDADDA